MYKFVVRWEKDGEAHSKEYDDEAQAKKARKWLEEHGASNIDIAARPYKPANPFPIGGK